MTDFYRPSDDILALGTASVAFLAAASPPVVQDAGVMLSVIGLVVVIVRGISLAYVARVRLCEARLHLAEAQRIQANAEREVARYRRVFGDAPGSDLYDPPADRDEG